jgi:hypothetical protein
MSNASYRTRRAYYGKNGTLATRTSGISYDREKKKYLVKQKPFIRGTGRRLSRPRRPRSRNLPPTEP